MGFKLSSEARKYFQQIDKKSNSGAFPLMWDKYHLSFMVGVTERRLAKEEPSGEPFLEEYSKDYYDQRHELLGSLVSAEIERKGISWDDEEKIRKLMLSLFDSSKVTNLSNLGIKTMNCYAQGGFEIIRDKISNPRELDEFLDDYYKFFILPYSD